MRSFDTDQFEVVYKRSLDTDQFEVVYKRSLDTYLFEVISVCRCPWTCGRNAQHALAAVTEAPWTCT